MGIALRPFLDLLPYRLDQALVGRNLNRLRIAVSRARSAPKPPLSTPTATLSQRRLFVDVSVISKHDAGTGIQRVVRSLALNLINEAKVQKWDLRFVAATRRRAYHEVSWLQCSSLSFEPIEARAGDVFVGLDYALDGVRHHSRQLARFRNNGGRLWFLVHDLLPLEKPEWFSRNTVIRYKAWLRIMAGIADGFLCNSSQTETELRAALEREYGLTEGYSTKVLPMGYCIAEAPVATTVAPRLPDVQVPYFLMVGTLEPRKGHADILDAFDALWGEGMKEALVLVGRRGWQVDCLRERIVGHPLNGTKLFWFDDVEDAELAEFYAASQGAIIASHAEGFGLPLIEALGYGKPVLARDIPVFRQHEAYGVRYFPVDADPSTLARSIRHWSAQVQEGAVEVSGPETSWGHSARELLQALSQSA